MILSSYVHWWESIEYDRYDHKHAPYSNNDIGQYNNFQNLDDQLQLSTAGIFRGSPHSFQNSKCNVEQNRAKFQPTNTVNVDLQ